MEELAWAAGLFDGEGHTRADVGWDTRDQCSRRALNMNIGMVNQDIVRRFHHAIGVGSLNGPYPGRSPNGGLAKPFLRWRVSSVDGVMLAAWRLWPWLSWEKRMQIDAAFHDYIQPG